MGWMKYRVVLSVSYVVEADSEDEAIEEALKLLEEELESGANSLADIFGGLAAPA